MPDLYRKKDDLDDLDGMISDVAEDITTALSSPETVGSI